MLVLGGRHLPPFLLAGYKKIEKKAWPRHWHRMHTLLSGARGSRPALGQGVQPPCLQATHREGGAWISGRHLHCISEEMAPLLQALSVHVKERTGGSPKNTSHVALGGLVGMLWPLLPLEMFRPGPKASSHFAVQGAIKCFNV